MSTKERKNLDEEYKDFLLTEEVRPSRELSDAVISKAHRYINPSSFYVLGKYCILFVLSVFVSLSLCPQSGVGLFRENFPLFHHFLHQNLVICAVYCAAIFFVTTHMLSYILLNRFEKIVLSKRLSYFPVALIAFTFGVLMLLTPVSAQIHFWDFTYVSTWILTIAGLYFLWKRHGVYLITQTP